MNMSCAAPFLARFFVISPAYPEIRLPVPLFLAPRNKKPRKALANRGASYHI